VTQPLGLPARMPRTGACPCGAPIKARGLCENCYARARRTGVKVNPRPTNQQRLLQYLTVNDESGCWEFTGALRRDGYAMLGWHGRKHYVHRISYQLFVGPIPDGLTIDHLCRNKACANPQHLEPVTPMENTRRATAKTHCIRGHERPAGKWCKECHRLCEGRRQRRLRGLPE
jgi:hypothetical protein